MSLAGDLAALQALDLELDEAQRALDRVNSLREESQELRAARSLDAQAQEERSRLARQLRLLELDVEGLRQKIAEAEQALYGGKIRSPKELSGLEQEVGALRRRQAQLEEEALEVMARLEEVESAQRAQRGELEKLEEAYRKAQVELSAEESRTTTLLHAWRQQRAKRVGRLAPDLLEEYEDLRRRKAGRAVAAVEAGVCRGCGVEVTARQIQQLRVAKELVQCSNCERILYLKEAG